ncbi:MAG TPA: hypothetical protein VFU23_02015 [Gemmatimonadales bacterium]|nr:hypothetical protein [Gemmatimonadales bacterium]
MPKAGLFAALLLLATPRQPLAQTVTPQTSNTTRLLVGLHPVNERVVWASGAGGTFLRTTDGGVHWQAGVVPGAEMVQFRDVHATDSLTAWLLSIPSGDSARIYHTTDGGAHWTLQFQNHDPAAFYDCFAFWDHHRAIAISDAVGGRVPILLTEDGGAHWNLLPQTAQPAADSGEGSPAASGTCVVAHGRGSAWLGTISGTQGARVLRTTDGGRSWKSAVTPIGHNAPGAGIFTLVFRDARRGFAAGSGDSTKSPTGRVASTADGGRTWHLTGDPSFKGTVYGLETVPGRPRTLLATGPGGSSISSDDGRTWTPLDAANHWTIAFATARTGWMVGPGGRISLIVLP